MSVCQHRPEQCGAFTACASPASLAEEIDVYLNGPVEAEDLFGELTPEPPPTPGPEPESGGEGGEVG